MGIATNDEDTQTRNADVHSLSANQLQNSPSLRVVAAISNALDVKPTSIPPLYDTIDPEALDRLLASEAAVEIVFEYEGHAIEIASDGSVTVDGVEEAAGDRQ